MDLNDFQLSRIAYIAENRKPAKFMMWERIDHTLFALGILEWSDSLMTHVRFHRDLDPEVLEGLLVLEAVSRNNRAPVPEPYLDYSDV